MTDEHAARLRSRLDLDERVAEAAARRPGGERGEWFRGDRTTGEFRGTDVWDLNSASDAERGWYKIADNLTAEVVKCGGATTGLELRSVKVGEATTFARACQACADASANTPAPVEQP